MTTYLNPALGLLPGSVSLWMLSSLLRALPRPDVVGSAALARAMLLDALAYVDAFGPRDRLEAMLVMQVPPLRAEAESWMRMAAAEPELERKLRLQRHAGMLQRRAEALGQEVRRHRRALEKQGLEHIAPAPQACDLAALEAAWRDPSVVLEEDVLVPQELPVPEGFGRVAPRVAEPPLESRAEFEAPPQPRFQGVPLWRQHGRRWLDELTDEELEEVTSAQLRGEVIEEAPVRPDHVPYPKGQEWRREGNWLSDEAMAAR